MDKKENIRATPLARKTAALLGISLETIVPSGPNGRILVKDVEGMKKIQNGSPMVTIGSVNAL